MIERSTNAPRRARPLMAVRALPAPGTHTERVIGFLLWAAFLGLLLGLSRLG